MRQTKIVATLGPAVDSDAAVVQLVSAGVDVFRLNFSHGTRETHAAMFQRVRASAARVGRTVAVLQDLSGPKIRTGRLAGGEPLELNDGDRLRIVIGDVVGGPGLISTAYAELARNARPGDRLLLDDGRIELRVLEVDGADIITTVVDGGLLGENKGINAPGVALPASALTAKDVSDLKFGLELGVDMIALSFVQTGSDLLRARDVLAAAGHSTLPIVAKVERPQAVENIDGILDACDGVMVARGDLGLEMPLERVPRVQKDITARARARGIPVILATQVLESMRVEPRPTRAEVSDAANAVDDGVDAIMLAGETAVGAFPQRTVETLAAIIQNAEALPPEVPVPRLTAELGGHGRALCDAAITLAARAHADAIVAVTRGGKTARLLSALRPRVPIYAITASEVVARRLTLYRGVIPLVSQIGNALEITWGTIERYLVDRGALAPGSIVVLVSVSPELAQPDANFLNLQRLGIG